MNISQRAAAEGRETGYLRRRLLLFLEEWEGYDPHHGKMTKPQEDRGRNGFNNLRMENREKDRAIGDVLVFSRTRVG